MSENAQQKVRRHMASLISMSPVFSVGEDHFIYKADASGKLSRFTSPKTNHQECFIVHEVLNRMPTGMLLNPYAAPIGPDSQDTAAFYDILCRCVAGQISMFLSIVVSALSTDAKNNPVMAKYLQYIEDDGEKSFVEGAMALVKDQSWVTCMFNIPKQQGLVRIIPLCDKDDKDFSRFVKNKKARHAIHGMLSQLFGGRDGNFVGVPTGSVAPASMSSRIAAFLDVYRSFVPNAHELYANAFTEEVVNMLPNVSAFEEAFNAIEEDTPVVRFRRSVQATTVAPVATTVTPAAPAMGTPLAPMTTNPMSSPIPGFNGNPSVPLGNPTNPYGNQLINQPLPNNGGFAQPTMPMQPFNGFGVPFQQPFQPQPFQPQPFQQGIIGQPIQQPMQQVGTPMAPMSGPFF